MDKTFVKGLQLLEALATSERPRGVTSLAQEIGFTKSNVHRLLGTLSACGYAYQTDLGDYQLTSKIWELGVLVRSRIDLIKVSRPHMERLAEQTGESVHLTVLDGLEVLILEKLESKHPIGVYSRVGGRAPAWCVSTGKAMLAQLPGTSRKIFGPVEAFTSKTITTPVALGREFDAIRSQGYAVNRGEWREGVFGIAAAVWDATGEVVGSVGIWGPGGRFPARRIISWASLVMSAGEEISRSLGNRRPMVGDMEKSTQA